MELLPNSALVQAAIVREEKENLRTAVHAIDPDVYQECLQKVEPGCLDEFKHSAVYLQNMSCVGCDHPDLQENLCKIEKQFGVKVVVQKIEACALTYSKLATFLNFVGVEVLMIDAEGHDCEILLSMIDHCSRFDDKNEDHWPDIIQFETMGHSDKIYGDGSESKVIDKLCSTYGYTCAHWGPLDTQLVKDRALREWYVREWTRSLHCKHCSLRGESGIPFSSCRDPSGDMVCCDCDTAMHWLGTGAFDWEQLKGDHSNFRSAHTDGDWLWALGQDGKLFRYHYQKQSWLSTGSSASPLRGSRFKRWSCLGHRFQRKTATR
jgi:hypothetical protein